MLFPHIECPPLLSCLSCSLHLPSFPLLSQKKSVAISKLLPELLLCQGVSTVCSRIWTRPGAVGPMRRATVDRLSCSSVLWLFPVWPLMWLCSPGTRWERRERTELHGSYSDISPLAQQPLFWRGLGGIHISEHFSSHPFWSLTQHWARKHHPACLPGSCILQKQFGFPQSKVQAKESIPVPEGWFSASTVLFMCVNTKSWAHACTAARDLGGRGGRILAAVDLARGADPQRGR